MGLSCEMYIIWMVNLAEIYKQMAKALFQLLKVKQSIEEREEAWHIKRRDAKFESPSCQKYIYFTQRTNLNTNSPPHEQKRNLVYFF